MRYTNIELTDMARTARDWLNITGRVPICYQEACKVINSNPTRYESILDYGSGVGTASSWLERKVGVRVTAFDIGPFAADFNDPDELPEQWDMIICSNVLNVQPDKQMVLKVIGHLWNLCESNEGTVILNYPKDPRRVPDLTSDDIYRMLRDVGFTLVRVGSGPAIRACRRMQ